MSNPAVGAKYVAALVVGVVGAGAFAGVSHDGRGGAPPADTELIVEVLSPTTTVGSTGTASASSTGSTGSTAPASTAQIASTLATQPAQPAPPDPVPTRARVRSRGS
jgi:hypothetical protein